MKEIMYNIGAIVLAVIIVSLWASIMLLTLAVSGVVLVCRHIIKGGNYG